MVPTRRRTLAGAATLLAALAGCNGTTDDPPPESDLGPRGEDPPENVATDPPTAVLRRPGSRTPVVEVPDPHGDDVSDAERERRRAVRRGFVTTPEAASLLEFADVEGVDDARGLLEATDFDAEFVFLDRMSVRQCYDLRLCRLTWNEYGLRRTYARVYRDYDVACHTDERDSVARFVRLEGSVDPGEMEDEGTAVHTGGCPVPRWERGGSDDGAEERARSGGGGR